MTATQLIADLDRLGVQLEAQGERLRYSPRSAVTPDLAGRLKTHKAELLAILQSKPTPNTSANNKNHLEGERLFPPDLMEALRAATVKLIPAANPSAQDGPG